jgi:hypothetical protein
MIVTHTIGPLGIACSNVVDLLWQPPHRSSALAPRFVTAAALVSNRFLSASLRLMRDSAASRTSVPYTE